MMNNETARKGSKGRKWALSILAVIVLALIVVVGQFVVAQAERDLMEQTLETSFGYTFTVAKDSVVFVDSGPDSDKTVDPENVDIVEEAYYYLNVEWAFSDKDEQPQEDDFFQIPLTFKLPTELLLNEENANLEKLDDGSYRLKVMARINGQLTSDIGGYLYISKIAEEDNGETTYGFKFVFTDKYSSPGVMNVRGNYQVAFKYVVIPGNEGKEFEWTIGDVTVIGENAGSGKPEFGSGDSFVDEKNGS